MKWAADLDAELRRLWGEGLPTAEIGRRMDISKNAVVGRAHRLGLSKRDTPIRRAALALDDAQRERLTALVRQGYTREQCARLLGVGRDLVMREAKRLVAPRVAAVSMGSAAAVARARAATASMPARQNSIGAAEGFRTRGADGGGGCPSLVPAANPIPAALAGDPGPGGVPGVTRPFSPGRESTALSSSTTDLPPVSAKAPAVFSKRCRFPLWGNFDRPDHRYCDAATALGAYCAEHAARCYVPPHSRVPGAMGATVGWGGR